MGYILIFGAIWMYGAGAAFPVLFLHFALTRHCEPWVRTLTAFAASWAWPVFLLAWLVGTYEPE